MQFKEREASKEHFKEGYLSLIPQGNSGQKKKKANKMSGSQALLQIELWCSHQFPSHIQLQPGCETGPLMQY